MTDSAALLKKATDGLQTLNVSEKYTHSALKWLETWLSEKTFEEYVPQIAYLINTQINAFGQFQVARRFDRWQGEPQPHLSKTDTSARLKK